MKKILIRIMSYLLFFCILRGIYGGVHLNPEDGNSEEYPVFNQIQLAPSVAVGVDWWSMYGHDAANTRYSSSTGPATNQMFIYKQILSNITVGNEWDILPDIYPVIVDNKLFFKVDYYYPFYSYSDQMYCANALTGSILWNKSLIGTSGISSVAVDGDVVYVAHYLGLICMNALDGTENWVYPIAITSAPVVAYEKIYIASSDNNIYCINKDGTKAWNTSFPYGTPYTPVVGDGKVYFVTVRVNSSTQIPSVSMYCLDAATGKEIWVYTLQNYYFTTSPTVADGKVFLTVAADFINNTILCLNAIGNGDGTTRLLWSVSKTENNPQGDLYNGPYPLAVADNRVYGTLNWADNFCPVLFCLDTAHNGADLWSYELCSETGSLTAPAVADGKVYVCGKNTVYCFDGAGYGNGTTELIWSYQRDGNSRLNDRFFAPIIANGKVWACGYNFLRTHWKYNAIYGVFVTGFGSNQPPEKPQTPNGPINGLVNEQYIYSTAPVSDPDGDAGEYQFDWDATDTHEYSEWSETPSIGHAWNKPGTYTVRVRARDIYQAESAWSDITQVTILQQPEEQLHVTALPVVEEDKEFIVTVTLNNNPVENALVEFAGSSKLTDMTGTAAFTAPSVDKDTAYTITAQYNDYRSVPIAVMVLDKSAEFNSWIFGVVTDTAGQPLYGASVCIALSGEQTKECTLTDEQGRYYRAVMVGTYTVEAVKTGYTKEVQQDITLREKNATAVDFNLENNMQPPDETQQLIDHAILDRNISGTIIFLPKENQIHYETSVYLSDVAFTVTSIEKTSISLLVNSENPAGSTIVFDINEGVFQSENLGLLINGEHIPKAGSLEDVLNAADDTSPEWFIQEKQTDGGVWLFVSIPHFSEYHITIYQLVEAVSKILLGTLYGAILVIGAGGAFYIVVFSGTLRFRKKRIKNENKKLEE